jgi:hypothetical protein
MSKAIALFNGGIHEGRQYAVREDGAVFKRFQAKHPSYGWRWTKWTATGETLGENARKNLDTKQSGFCTLLRVRSNDSCINNRAWFDAAGNLRVRLP